MVCTHPVASHVHEIVPTERWDSTWVSFQCSSLSDVCLARNHLVLECRNALRQFQDVHELVLQLFNSASIHLILVVLEDDVACGLVDPCIDLSAGYHVEQQFFDLDCSRLLKTDFTRYLCQRQCQVRFRQSLHLVSLQRSNDLLDEANVVIGLDLLSLLLSGPLQRCWITLFEGLRNVENVVGALGVPGDNVRGIDWQLLQFAVHLQ
mmetsp:Transcript_78512/g.182154  ORF Transcript_78512/g.182154 Transcript_78512/m.182154 type:complete len:207 (+) Transcript_78512:44-664(+)